MLRKQWIFLLLCCLFASTAKADTLVDSLRRVETLYPFSATDALPLPDGGIVLSGQVAYKSQYRTADMEEVDRLTKNVVEDGYAICLNADGTKRWDFYGGMSDHWNNCIVLGMLPDGRVLLTVRHIKDFQHDKQLFSYYYIDQMGNVEKDEQLYGQVASAFDPETLSLVSEGLIGGANTAIVNWNGEFPTDATLLDFDGREVWRHNPSNLGSNYWLYFYEVSDGYLLYGSDYHYSFSTESVTIVRKLDREGSEVWTFQEKSNSYAASATQLTEMPDGSILFTSVYSPDGIKLDAYRNPLFGLTKLDKDGNHLWSRFYDGDGYANIGGTQPLNGGIVLSATVQFPEHELLLLDADGNITGRAAYGDPQDADYGNLPPLVRGQDGSVYAFGTLHEEVPPDSLTGGAVICPFYIKIDESLFE